jgi:hypothetical protein
MVPGHLHEVKMFSFDTCCWYLGEFLLWIHLPYALAVMLLGVFFIINIFLVGAHNIIVGIMQIACRGCPLVKFACWLQGRNAEPGWVQALYERFGPWGPALTCLALCALSVCFAMTMTARRLRRERRLNTEARLIYEAILPFISDGAQKSKG